MKALTLLVIIALASAGNIAKAQTLNDQQAVELALERNPSLRAS